MTERTEGARRYEVVVIGGGAAGLSGAMALARSRRSVLVVDAGRPRNAPAGHIHNYLGREGMPPEELLARGRAEVEGYGGEIVPGEVAAVERLDGGGFRVALADGTRVAADRLLVATGLADELPEVPGLAERWGRDVLHCPYCHGYEVRDQAIGILNTGPMTAHQVLLWRQLSADLTVFQHTGPEPSAEEREQYAARGVTLVEGEVARLEVTGDRLTGAVLADGRVVRCQALVVAPRFTARGGVLAGLGLRPTQQERDGHVIGEYIAADPTGATEVPGVWVAGNVASVTEQLVGAVTAGLRAGAMINGDLAAEETRRAVAARRAGFSARDESELTEQVLGDRRHGL
ncbi:NAD(P)/FAD-dependent oxidoreductase [Allonocardiopsis opalescens]|uniref:Thioredoxin reductase n=1 Tax=Allonocardiopsis opalescens TaxID=1144618 RepID=A0A2T0Q570_9ACTN|nr:NAD(P)/FAD-dependent oxidoreductase [Allonocardiopsis opalescens]PRX98919.1 thioredoxin reductase [Allonocardiopsis opalescens]